MSENIKPPIYAFCPAGCKWETVHKSDFIDGTTYVKQIIDNNNRCYLETGKQYKIMSEYNSGWGCSISLAYSSNGTATTYNFVIPHDDVYADSIVFKVLGMTVNETNITMAYEIAGIRYFEYISGTNITMASSEYLYVDNANDVLLYNADANITLTAKDGLSSFASSLTNTTQGTTSIAKNTLTVPSDRSIQIGDLILCADNNVFKTEAIGSTNITVEYFTNVKGEQGEVGPIGPSGTVAEVVQTIGTSTENVMSQNAITSLIGVVDRTAETTRALPNDYEEGRVYNEIWMSDVIGCSSLFNLYGLNTQALVTTIRYTEPGTAGYTTQFIRSALGSSGTITSLGTNSTVNAWSGGFCRDETLMAHPINSIYMSVNSTSPASIFGGTWEQIKDKFLLACGNTYSNGATGGEATHTLSVDEMPSHSHTMRIMATDTGSISGNSAYVKSGLNSQEGQATTNATGGGQSHNNMPPYLAVYVWKRTA